MSSSPFFPSEFCSSFGASQTLKLTIQDNCGGFIDPLIEAPHLLLFLDLVLLKPRVFLHLLFNRGSPPRKAGERAKSKPPQVTPAADPSPSGTEARAEQREIGAEPGTVAERAADAEGPQAEEREGAEGAQVEVVARPAETEPRRTVEPRAEAVHSYLVRLFTVTVLAEVAVRLASSSLISFSLLSSTSLRVALELGAQLATSTLLALVLLRVMGWYQPKVWGLYEPGLSSSSAEAEVGDQKAEREQKDGRQRGFLPSLIPLVLLYTTLLPLLLQLGLSVWSTAASPHSPQPSSTPLSESFGAVAPWIVKLIPADVTEQIDRAWASSNKLWLGTRLLGGMSAGFGLRVLLPTPPLLTTTVVLAGWGAALGVGSLLDSYV